MDYFTAKMPNCIHLFLLSLFVLYGTTLGGEYIRIEYRIIEELPAKTIIGDLAADSQLVAEHGSGVLSQVQFSLVTPGTPNQVYFTVDASTGLLRTSKVLDRDHICPGLINCLIKFDVIVQPSKFYKLIEVHISVKDTNDNPPKFTSNLFRKKISESAQIGEILSIPPAEDLDSPNYGIKEYKLLSSMKNPVFELKYNQSNPSGNDLNLILVHKLDREQEDQYSFTIQAMDKGMPPKVGVTLVKIEILDSNDHNPSFQQINYVKEVSENVSIGTMLCQVQAIDLDINNNADIVYKFSPPTERNFGHLFGVNSTSGKIWLKRKLAHDVRDEYTLGVLAIDGGSNPLTGKTTVTIKVLDVNDHRPDISVSIAPDRKGVLSVSEAAKIGDFVAHLTIDDKDSGVNGQFSCAVSNEAFGLVHVRRNAYKLVTKLPLDFDKRSVYNISISCKDLGIPSLISFVPVSIKLLDENDNSPTFAPNVYTLTLPEGNAPNKVITQVKATDLDSGVNGRITYSIDDNLSSTFAVDSDSGVVYAVVPLNYEASHRQQFYVVATDHGDPPNTASALVQITLEDVNDEKPRFGSYYYSLHVQENQPIGSRVGQILAVDKDSDLYNNFVFSLPDSHSNTPFTIDKKTGEIRTKEILNREDKGSYRFSIYVHDTDRPSFADATTVFVTITDINDNKPQITFPDNQNNTLMISTNLKPGQKVGQILAYDLDLNMNSALVYEIVAGNENGLFMLHNITGGIFLLGPLGEEDSTHKLRISVKDCGNPSQISESNLFIIANKSLLPPGYAAGDLTVGVNMTIIIAVVTSAVLLVCVLLVVIALVRVGVIGRRRRAGGQGDLVTGGVKPELDHKGYIPSRPATVSQFDAIRQPQKSPTGSTDNFGYHGSHGANLHRIHGNQHFQAIGEHDLQVQKWLNSVSSDDKDSDNSSGEISNPDSGRGTDEPDTQHRVVDKNAPVLFQHNIHRCSDRPTVPPRLLQRAQDTFQRKPKPKCVTFNLENEKRTSYGSECPVEPNENILKCDSHDNISDNLLKFYHNKTQGNQQYLPNSDVGYIEGADKYAHLHNLDTPSLLHTLSTQPQYRDSVSSAQMSDGASTTSGSYVIDHVDISGEVVV